MRPVFPDRCCQCVQSKRDSGRFARFRSVRRELPALARPLLPQRQSSHGTERPQCPQFWRRPVLLPWRPPSPLCHALPRDKGVAALERCSRFVAAATPFVFRNRLRVHLLATPRPRRIREDCLDRVAGVALVDLVHHGGELLDRLSVMHMALSSILESVRLWDLIQHWWNGCAVRVTYLSKDLYNS